MSYYRLQTASRSRCSNSTADYRDNKRRPSLTSVETIGSGKFTVKLLAKFIFSALICGSNV
jgi:hypothetical protein